MKFLDDVVEWFFGGGAPGDRVFFPWGPIADGYVLDSEATEEKLRLQTRRFVIAAAIALLFLIVIDFWLGAAAVTATGLWRYQSTSALTANLRRAD